MHGSSLSNFSANYLYRHFLQRKLVMVIPDTDLYLLWFECHMIRSDRRLPKLVIQIKALLNTLPYCFIAKNDKRVIFDQESCLSGYQVEGELPVLTAIV